MTRRIGKIWWYWINDNRQPGDRRGSILRNGRLCLHLGEWCELVWSWSLLKWFCHAEIRVSDDGGITFSTAVPGVATWFTIDPRPLRGFCRRWDWYGLEVSVHHWAIWISLWADESVTNYADPWWKRRKFSLHLKDALLGRTKHSKRILSTSRAEVPMPEGTYPAKVDILENTWKRPRWPWPSRKIRADVEMAEPIPFPGKGENSWDCGEDALFRTVCSETTVEDAVAAVVKDVLRMRRRHGGPSWKPAGAA